uniref:Putative cellulose synthase A catalytic synthase, plant conserved region n=1 Tax=Myoviridae sp. ctfvB24 TaxID=2826679 RepID=A0A8S5M9L9_9CAUD|nr:MAG TPA: putative cellulose synthase A catalytic synthase, plant conserved region [Myoviridae sp. ctfvB24]
MNAVTALIVLYHRDGLMFPFTATLPFCRKTLSIMAVGYRLK